MRIFALETSTRQASIALLEDETLQAAATLPAEQTTAEALTPAMAEQLAAAQWAPADIDLIAVSQGPGSFTGLRVGITAAKTLAYATEAEVIAVNSLEVIARQVPPTTERIWSVMDAQRQQVFAACFQQAGDKLNVVHDTKILDNRQWLEQLNGPATVSGPALEKLQDALPTTVTVTRPELWRPTAESVGVLALYYYRQGRRNDLWQLVPRYYRKSAAEEKLADRIDQI